MLVYLDSCIVIYLVEPHVEYSAIIRREILRRGTVFFCVSPLVAMEVLVRPMRDRNEILTRRFHQYLAAQQMLSMSDGVFEIALNLRVNHGLKIPDALHLATAVIHGCSEFWTNDNRLITVAPKLAVNLLRDNDL